MMIREFWVSTLRWTEPTTLAEQKFQEAPLELLKRALSPLLLSLMLLIGISKSVQAAPVTYTYQGPSFFSATDHLSVSFTTSAPLAANRSYLSQADAQVTASSVTVVGVNGPLTNFTLPVTTFQVHTNASGQIDAWYIFGDFNSLAGLAPTMTGTDRQAYTMNTLTFIPGSDIPGATGLVTGPYDYDQATDTQFYASCNGAPTGCTLAGNGQPYLGIYSGIINPSNTSGSSWTASTGSTTPPPSTCSGTNAVITSVGRDFIVVNGGAQLADHVWYTPTPAGTTFTGGTTTFINGELVDFSGNLDPVAGCYATAMTVKPAPSQTCTAPPGAKTSHSQGVVTAVGSGYVQTSKKRIDYAACTTFVYPAGQTLPAVGNKVEWWGYVETNGNIMARKLKFN
jgi:hypothetical protein